MISQEQFVSAIESMRLQKYDDKKNGQLLAEAFSMNEFPIFDNDKLVNTIIDLLSIWLDKEELVNYCIHCNFGKIGLESEWETAEQLYSRIKNKKMIPPLTLKCFWVPDDVAEESELTNKPISDDDIEEKEITFYVIEHVRFNSDHNCTIISGGFEYLVNETYESVNAKIAERMTFKFN